MKKHKRILESPEPVRNPLGWTSFSYELQDHESHGTVLWVGQLPWTIAIDFMGIDDNDRFVVRVESLPRELDNWRLAEFYKIHRGRPRSDYPGGLIVNEMPIGPEMILMVRPTIIGPWQSRLTFSQVSGTPRVLAYSVLND